MTVIVYLLCIIKLFNCFKCITLYGDSFVTNGCLKVFGKTNKSTHFEKITLKITLNVEWKPSGKRA